MKSYECIRIRSALALGLSARRALRLESLDLTLDDLSLNLEIISTW